MAFLELLLGEEVVGDAADLPEALELFQQLKPEDSSWEQLCSDPATLPSIRRYSSFEAFLDNADALETIALRLEQLVGMDNANDA